MKPLVSITALVLTLGWTQSGQCGNRADDLLGQWYTENNESKVVITKENGKYVGAIIWLKEPLYGKDEAETGKPKRDKNNPTKRLRNRPIVGLRILKGFTFNARDNSWENGTIYDPESGKTYKCEINFEQDSKALRGRKLHVRGYIGLPILGRTTYWHYVPKRELEDLDD